jgi:hypothetical protein
MFWASDTFAPKCALDGLPVSEYLQDHFNGAYGQYVLVDPAELTSVLPKD